MTWPSDNSLCATTAPTGLAALNADGITIYSCPVNMRGRQLNIGHSPNPHER